MFSFHFFPTTLTWSLKLSVNRALGFFYASFSDTIVKICSEDSSVFHPTRGSRNSALPLISNSEFLISVYDKNKSRFVQKILIELLQFEL